MAQYKTLCDVFTSKNCQLLTTEEEFNNISSELTAKKLKYIASCGHEHEIIYRFFKNQNRGITCPKCMIKNGIEKRQVEYYTNNKLYGIKLEYDSILYFMNLIANNFTCIKAFDACRSDIIIKPKNIDENKYIGIQVKSTSKKNKDNLFSFCIGKTNYENLLLVCIALETKQIWILPYNNIKNITKINFKEKSKYSNYEITEKNDINKIMLDYYNELPKFEFDYLNKPISIFQQREQEYRKFREEKIKFLDFKYNDMEGFVYDFTINNLKVQEKVCGESKSNSFQFNLKKTKSEGNGKKLKQCYNKDDNDFYWLNCDNKKHFYIFPQEILIEKKYIECNIAKSLILYPLEKNKWYNDYLYDYENLDIKKIKLLFCVN